LGRVLVFLVLFASACQLPLRVEPPSEATMPGGLALSPVLEPLRSVGPRRGVEMRRGLGAKSDVGQEQADDEDEDDLTALSLEDLLELEYEMPMSVLGAHTHHAGEYMIGLTTSYMKMGGSRDGKSRVSNGELLKTYPTVHTEMRVRTTVLTAMYAPTDETTYMTMVPKVRKESRHLRTDGTRFTEVTDGIGDVQLHALHTFHREGADRMHFDAGISLPTGSIDEGEGGQREHYMQQLGSGTVDLLPGVTYLFEAEQWAWGAQVSSVLRLGENKHDYRLGNRYALTSWVQSRFNENVAVSLRLNAQQWGNIRGMDKSLDPALISENDTSHYGGRRVDALVGLSYYGTEGALQGHRVELEGGWPIYQHLDGPQLEVDYVVKASWKVVF
jgi:hypothetical protein